MIIFGPKPPPASERRSAHAGLAAVTLVGAAALTPATALAVQCDREITANVVVLDNPTVFNRLGAQNPNWITYALERDVVHATGVDANVPCRLPDGTTTGCQAGNVMLRPDKRPRPLVVRSAAGDCLTVNFTNLLAPAANPNNAIQDNLINNDQVADRHAGFHPQGVELLGIGSDASFVGTNGNSLVLPGVSTTYRFFTPHEGTFTVNSYGATIGSEASGGNLGMGMFAQLNVQPKGARLYRSQVTEEELRLATVGTVPSDCAAGDVVGVDCNLGGQPIINYEAEYPNFEPWISEGKAGLPILNMLDGNELVHSDINAIIAGPNADGTFPPSTYPLEGVGKNVPNLPNRLEPFREFSSIFHDEQANTQVFPQWYLNPVLQYTLAGVKDAFMINYGSGGIGSEIIANRLHTGPMHDCTDCAYEEFFLASQTVGDPGMLVNFPANTGIEQCDPANILSAACWRQFDTDGDGVGDVGANPPIPGNFALYQEDPANVHHAYTGDQVKIRNIHAGAFEQHIFHLHNHQWLFNPNDDNANYLDAQEIVPGSGHTYELANGGAGNRNKTVGDAIFHCHFYPHFAQGMWYHIRNHDVFERGTVLAVSGADDPQSPSLDIGFHTQPFALRSGQPAVGARALPDGELLDGSPIPAVVPLPGKAMPQMPAEVTVAAVDRGDFGVLSGRTPPNGLGQGPDSAQAVVDRVSVAGADGVLRTADDVSPGFPFWLAGNECGPDANPPAGVCDGIVGQRMPTPALDMLTEAGATANGYSPDQAGGWDGGLPRHALLGYTAGGLSLDTQNRLNLSKVVERAQPVYFPEIGTDLEQVSMAYQAVRERPSAANNLADTGTVPGSFVLNGAPPVPGGPYNDPCVDDQGDPLLAGVVGDFFDGDNDPSTLATQGASAFSSANPRTYKVANIQIDAVFNKVGYHYPQERIIALWEDVAPTIAKLRPPEPLVMRFNTFDCGKLLHTNLVPGEFELDDFQVRTPTDIIGQHIHLPKWDLTTNDGAANGWNYEDGALSPAIVQERIHAINLFNEEIVANDEAAAAGAALPHPDLEGLAVVPTIDTGDPGSNVAAGETLLTAQPHPFFGTGVGNEYLGARTVIQRLFVDPIVNVAGVDRGLGITFSHDHYGPSTFQQIGLYSTILVEPAGSTWVHNETGVPLGIRDDGGPTTWHAAILPPAAAPQGSTVGSEDIPDHREFYFEMSDFQHAYEAGVYVGAGPDGRPIKTTIEQPDPFNATVAFAPALQDTWQRTINPPLKLKSVPFPDVVTANSGCPGPLGNNDANVPRPCAEAINIGHSSMFVVNYRNEPVGLRVFDPNKVGPDGGNGAQADGPAGDLAFAFQSRNDRAIGALNTALGVENGTNGPPPYPAAPYCQGTGDLINCDRNAGDPFTPIMRAYERDEIKVKIQVGATEEQHQVTVHGMKWLSNGSGFGRSPNSGWRNFQSHGISEQFSLQVPFNPDRQQRGNTVDYLYASDATRDGIWTGAWGILRSYGTARNDLFELPDNPQRGNAQVVNQNNFDGVCPTVVLDQNGDPVDPQGPDRTIPIVPVRYEVAAVLANDVLPNAIDIDGNGVADIAISPNTQVVDTVTGLVLGGDSDGDGLGDNAGGPLDTAGGTLVYNRRGTLVPTVRAGEGADVVTLQGGAGPLNDPTAMMYVRLDDLEPRFVAGVSPDANADGIDDRCQEADGQGGFDLDIGLPGCPVQLAAGAPVEPLVLRANAGDCLEVTLHNKLIDQAVVAGNGPVFSCQDDGLGACLPGTEEPLFDPQEAQDALDQGLLLVDAGGVQVALAEIAFDRVPDLAGWQDVFWVVNRDLFNPVRNPLQMRFFNNNLIAPSDHVGLHAQLVEYDASQDDGLLVGGNNVESLVRPGGQRTYRYYAGDLRTRNDGVRGNTRRLTLIPTPVEFGGTNLLSADRVKQPQKGLFGALVIEPAGATYDETTQVADGQGMGEATRLTRAQATITSDPGDAGSGGIYREALAIGHRIANLRWADGGAITNVNQFELGREGAEDSGHAGFNYAMEPSWFRFELPPDVPFGNALTANSFGSIANAHAMYANALVSGEPNAIPLIAGISAAGDPQTPVFRATAGDPARMHVLNGASADRDGTFMLHGHVWQRDPFVCPGESDLTLAGRCDPSLQTVDSTALGLNPQGKYLAAEEGMGHVYGYWPVLFDAGGTGAVAGDYLYRDYSPSGNRNGQFGILRVD